MLLLVVGVGVVGRNIVMLWRVVLILVALGMLIVVLLHVLVCRLLIMLRIVLVLVLLIVFLFMMAVVIFLMLLGNLLWRMVCSGRKLGRVHDNGGSRSGRGSCWRRSGLSWTRGRLCCFLRRCWSR